LPGEESDVRILHKKEAGSLLFSLISMSPSAHPKVILTGTRVAEALA